MSSYGSEVEEDFELAESVDEASHAHEAGTAMGDGYIESFIEPSRPPTPEQSMPVRQQQQRSTAVKPPVALAPSYSSDFEDTPVSPPAAAAAAASTAHSRPTLAWPPLTSLPLEIQDMSQILRQFISGEPQPQAARVLESHLLSLQGGLAELKERRAKEDRERRVAAREKKKRSAERRLRHLETLAQLNQRVASLEHEVKRHEADNRELNKLLESTESEADYTRQSLEASERARLAAEQVVKATAEELEAQRIHAHECVKRAEDKVVAMQERFNALEVEGSRAAALWQVERERMEEHARAESQRLREEGCLAIDRVKVEKLKAETEVSMLRQALEKLEARMDQERNKLPHHHQAMLEKELAVVRGEAAALERQRAAMEAEKARMWDELEAWRMRLDAEERAVKGKLSVEADESRREITAARSAMEEERRRVLQDLTVAETKTHQAAAQVERDKAAMEREKTRLQQESALLAVRAGLLAPQLQEIDRAYADLRTKQAAMDEKECSQRTEGNRLTALERDMIKQQHRIKDALVQADGYREECEAARKEKQALLQARLQLREHHLRLSRQSHSVRRAVTLLRRVTSLLPVPDPLTSPFPADRGYDYVALIDAVARCVEDAARVGGLSAEDAWPLAVDVGHSDGVYDHGEQDEDLSPVGDHGVTRDARARQATRQGNGEKGEQSFDGPEERLLSPGRRDDDALPPHMPYASHLERLKVSDLQSSLSRTSQWLSMEVDPLSKTRHDASSWRSLHRGQGSEEFLSSSELRYRNAAAVLQQKVEAIRARRVSAGTATHIEY